MQPMRSTWREIPAFVWLGGALIVALLGIAGGLALLGYGLAGIKLALFAGLFPGLLLMAAWLTAVLREPGWFRSPRLAVGFLITAGSVLFLVPLFIWLPFSPAMWPVEAMPFVLRLPFITGLLLLSGGVVLQTLLTFGDAWRKRDYLTLLAAVVALGLCAYLAATAIITRLA